MKSRDVKLIFVGIVCAASLELQAAYARDTQLSTSPTPTASPSREATTATREAPSTTGYLPNTPSNDSQDRQLKDMGIGPAGSDSGGSSGANDGNNQSSSSSSNDN